MALHHALGVRDPQLERLDVDGFDLRFDARANEHWRSILITRRIDVEDDGRVFIAAVDQEAGQKAIDWIKGLTDEVEVGKIYKGKVVRIMPFGLFVEVLPNQDGLVHVSKLTDHRVERPEEVANVGDEIMVKATEIDSQGRLNLSRQAAIEELTSRGEPVEERIDMDAVAAALAMPPPVHEPRDRNGGGGGFRGGRGGRGGGR